VFRSIQIKACGVFVNACVCLCKMPAACSGCAILWIESEQEPEARDNETPVPVRAKEITKWKN
jgi:hypothetical protein